MRRHVRAMALAVVAVLVVAACGSGDDDDAGSTAGTAAATSDGSVPASAAAATGAPAATDDGGSGGTLIVGMTATNFPGLDTVRGSSEGGEGNRFVTNQLYDGLTKWDLTARTSRRRSSPGWPSRGTCPPTS